MQLHCRLEQETWAIRHMTTTDLTLRSGSPEGIPAPVLSIIMRITITPLKPTALNNNKLTLTITINSLSHHLHEAPQILQPQNRKVLSTTSTVDLSSAARDDSEPALARVRKMSYFDLSESETKVSCTVEPGGPACLAMLGAKGTRTE